MDSNRFQWLFPYTIFRVERELFQLNHYWLLLPFFLLLHQSSVLLDQSTFFLLLFPIKEVIKMFYNALVRVAQWPRLCRTWNWMIIVRRPSATKAQTRWTASAIFLQSIGCEIRNNVIKLPDILPCSRRLELAEKWYRNIRQLVIWPYE